MRKVWLMSCFQGSRLVGTTPREEQAVTTAAGGGSLVDAHVDAGPKPKHPRFLMRRARAKQTVPVQVDSGHIEVAMDEGRKREEEVKVAGQPAAVAEAKRSPFRRFFAKLHKAKARRAGPAEPPAAEVEISSSGTLDSGPDTMGTRTSRLSGSPKVKASDPAASSLRTARRKPSKATNSRSGETSGKKDTDDGEETTPHSNVTGLAILVVLILAFLVGGLFFAILCTCTFFYLVPLFRPPIKKPVPNPRERKKKTVEVNYDSEEHKKRVVLEGMLERNRKRPPEFR